MELEAVPLLPRLRALYEGPRDAKRFRRYLFALAGNGEDMALPISGFNPMARDHVRDALDHLLAVGADEAVREACVDAARRLAACERSLRVALVPADDVGGMWTERAQSELRSYREANALTQRGCVVVTTWTSERPDAEAVRVETLRTIARVAYASRQGEARTVREIMAQEGEALRFAGAPAARRDERDIAATRAALAPHRDATEDAILIPALAGDEVAEWYGYAPLGVAPGAALALALAEAASARR